MSAGLILRDRSGKVISDMTGSISKQLGTFETGTANGTITVDISMPGSVFYTQVPIGDGGRTAKKAGVTYLGNGVFTWSFSYQDGIGNYSQNSRVAYGVY